jgi:hypothetical protein
MQNGEAIQRDPVAFKYRLVSRRVCVSLLAVEANFASSGKHREKTEKDSILPALNNAVCKLIFRQHSPAKEVAASFD